MQFIYTRQGFYFPDNFIPNFSLLLVFVKWMRFQAATISVRQPLSAHMLQVEIWIPWGDVTVFLGFTPSFVVPAANPTGNLGRSVLFFSFTFWFSPTFSRRIGTSLTGSNSAS